MSTPIDAPNEPPAAQAIPSADTFMRCHAPCRESGFATAICIEQYINLPQATMEAVECMGRRDWGPAPRRFDASTRLAAKRFVARFESSKAAISDYNLLDADERLKVRRALERVVEEARLRDGIPLDQAVRAITAVRPVRATNGVRRFLVRETHPHDLHAVISASPGVVETKGYYPGDGVEFLVTESPPPAPRGVSAGAQWEAQSWGVAINPRCGGGSLMRVRCVSVGEGGRRAVAEAIRQSREALELAELVESMSALCDALGVGAA